MKKTPKVINRFNDKYKFLSNFYMCDIVIYRRTFPSSEHAYQALKSNNPTVWDEFIKLKTAREARKFGKEIKLRENWESMKLANMYIIVKKKFDQNENIKKLLIETDNAKLIEGNTWGDTFWGICNGVGKNHLGKILMRVRDELTQRNGLFI